MSGNHPLSGTLSHLHHRLIDHRIDSPGENGRGPHSFARSQARILHDAYDWEICSGKVVGGWRHRSSRLRNLDDLWR